MLIWIKSLQAFTDLTKTLSSMFSPNTKLELLLHNTLLFSVLWEQNKAMI